MSKQTPTQARDRNSLLLVNQNTHFGPKRNYQKQVNTPNLEKKEDKMLRAAAGKVPGFEISQITPYDRTELDDALAHCQTFTGLDGLRKLQLQQRDKSILAPGCGWLYQKPNTGSYMPVVNRGTFGNYDTTYEAGSPPGAKYTSDLEQMERDIATDTIQRFRTCGELQNIPGNANGTLYGFCTDTRTIIPINTNNGVSFSRFPRDAKFACKPTSIVNLVKDCPRVDGFQNKNTRDPPVRYQTNHSMVGNIPGNGMAAGLPGLESFKNCGSPAKERVLQGFQNSSSTSYKEAFVGRKMDDIQQCTGGGSLMIGGRLSSDCVVLAAQKAGCNDQGSLIKALNESVDKNDYSSILKQNKAFAAYQQSTTPLEAGMLQSGLTTITNALQNFYNLFSNTQPEIQQYEKVRLAAKDLCTEAGAFDKYDFCLEINTGTKITKDTMVCLQDMWLQKGWTKAGSGYQAISSFVGQTKGSFQTYMDTLESYLKSTDSKTYAYAVEQTYGVTQEQVLQDQTLPIHDYTNGTETLWYLMDRNNIILVRCDLQLKMDGATIPSFSNKSELSKKYMSDIVTIPSGYIVGFMSLFELRTTSATTAQFQLTSIGNTKFGYNMPPLLNNKPPIADETSVTRKLVPKTPINLSKDSPNTTNTIVIHYQQKEQDSAAFDLQMKIGGGIEGFASASTCPNGESAPAPYKSIVYDCPKIDRAGGTYSHIYTDTFQGCADKCDSDPTCKSFTWAKSDPNYNNKAGGCYLKSDVPQGSVTWGGSTTIGLQSGVKTSGSSGGDKVTFATKCDADTVNTFQAWSFYKTKLGVGRYPNRSAADAAGGVSSNGAFQYWVSCIDIPSNMKITLYTQDNYQGESISFEGPKNQIGLGNYPLKTPVFLTDLKYTESTWNDVVRSVVIESISTPSGPSMPPGPSMPSGPSMPAPPPNPGFDSICKQNIYLTQEPVAPWLQIEVCQRGGSSVGFNDYRWYVPGMTSEFIPSSKPANAQYTTTSTADSPNAMPYMTLEDTTWATKYYISLSSLHTMTFLINPSGMLTSGSSTRIFDMFHISPTLTPEQIQAGWANMINPTFVNIAYSRNGDNYMLTPYLGGTTYSSVPIRPNTWSFVALQFIGTSSGIYKLSIHCRSMSELNITNNVRAMLADMKSQQNHAGTYKISYTSDVSKTSGSLNITAEKNVPIKIAWIHGFRTYLDREDVLYAEIFQTWKSRWPLGVSLMP